MKAHSEVVAHQALSSRSVAHTCEVEDVFQLPGIPMQVKAKTHLLGDIRDSKVNDVLVGGT